MSPLALYPMKIRMRDKNGYVHFRNSEKGSLSYHTQQNNSNDFGISVYIFDWIQFHFNNRKFRRLVKLRERMFNHEIDPKFTKPRCHVMFLFASST
jgi:hypothetical protein